MSVDTTPSPSQSSPRSQDEILFQECRYPFLSDCISANQLLVLTSGVNVLHSTTVNNSLLVHGLPQLCQQSRALYAICLAFQVTLTPDLRPRFFEYFDAALSTFRSELAMSVTGLDDGTLTAGLLLCSIGVCRPPNKKTEHHVHTKVKRFQIIHGLPWTMHLEGMHSILQSHGLDNYRSPFRTHLIEVMGVMDMPTFAVGRQNPNIGIWRRYCRKNGRPDEDVEPVSGLPRSLLDIFACIGEGATEETFWDWPGERGSFLQCHLWEAFRLAGILACRQLQQRQTRLRQRQQRQLLNGQLVGGPKLKDYPPSSSSPSSASSPTTPSSSWSSRQPRLPRTEILVARILASLDALRRACTEPTEPTEKDSLIINAIEYPIFVAGLEVDLMNANPEWKRAIMECFADRYRQETGEENRLATQLLEELWTRGEGDVNELARERGLELGLF